MDHIGEDGARKKKEVKDIEKINKKKRERRGDWCPELWLFEGMSQPLIQVFKYLMQGGIKRDRLAPELSVKARIYYRESVCDCVCEHMARLTALRS